MAKTRIWLLTAVCALMVGPAGVAEAAQLTWWSHWAVEDSKKAVLFEVKRRFEAKHPGNTVEITFCTSRTRCCSRSSATRSRRSSSGASCIF